MNNGGFDYYLVTIVHNIIISNAKGKNLKILLVKINNHLCT